MPELPDQSARCRHCQAVLGVRTVTITEADATTSADGVWVLCSWACARELVVRMVRSARDDR